MNKTSVFVETRVIEKYVSQIIFCACVPFIAPIGMKFKNDSRFTRIIVYKRETILRS